MLSEPRRHPVWVLAFVLRLTPRIPVVQRKKDYMGLLRVVSS